VCNLAVELNGFFLIPLIVIYVVIFGLVFSSIVYNIRSLHAQFIVLQETMQAQPHENPAYQKLWMYRRLQYILTTYILLKLLAYFSIIVVSLEGSSSLWHQLVWINVLIDEVIEVGCISNIGYVFRLRDFTPYARFNNMREEDVDQALEIEIQIDDPNVLGFAPQHQPQEDEYRPSLNLARLPEHKNAEQAPVVLVEHPASADGKSSLVHSIATEPAPEKTL
jgi:hypothetical protein